MNTVTIEVVLAHPDEVISHTLTLPLGSSVSVALSDSGLIARIPHPHSYPTGIFGRIVNGDYILRDGDRLELYRPLIADPKAARRDRAEASRPIRGRKHPKPTL